ncbi:hypothetical protein EG329_002327 [Mollisiaceae sp. DMI_Dod_QoI]|nr:hypothetical protein EG329_002327 [Helotiales sp. DMI_Dod_QoI]
MMDAHHAALDLFDKLPDANQELYVPLGKCLDTFTLFGNLPSEIRVDIWKLCFPKPRSVVIGESNLLSHKERERQRRAERSIPLPITLRVCAQSRVETLRRYTLVWWDDLGIEGEFQLLEWQRLICFDHERDSLYVIWGTKQGLIPFSSFIIGINIFCNNCLTKITSFEIRQPHSNLSLLHTIMRAFDSEDSWPLEFTPQAVEGLRQWILSEPALDGLLYMPGLRRVTFSVSTRNREHDAVLDSWRTLMEAYLKIHSNKFYNETEPELVVRKGKKNY